MKQIDLDIAHLKELDHHESQDLYGGLFGIDDLVIGLTVAAATAIINDWSCFKDGLAGKLYNHQK